MDTLFGYSVYTAKSGITILNVPWVPEITRFDQYLTPENIVEPHYPHCSVSKKVTATYERMFTIDGDLMTFHDCGKHRPFMVHWT